MAKAQLSFDPDNPDYDPTQVFDDLGLGGGTNYTGGSSTFNEKQNTAPPPTAPQATDGGNTQEKWLNFVGQQTGGQTVSRGGSQGGYITGGNGYRGNLQSLADAYNAANGGGAKAVGDDKIDFGDGRGPVDVITGGGDFWYGSGGGGDAGGGGSSGAGATGATQAFAASNPYDFSGLQKLLEQQMAQNAARDAETKAYKDRIHSSILGTIDQYGKPIDENDPNVGAATRAYRGEGERALELEREAMAERAHATGASSGSVEAGTKQGFQNLGQNIGSYKANLMIKQLTEQRQMLMSALQMGAGLLSAEEAQGVQGRLGTINSQLQSYGIQANTGLAKDKLAQDSQLGNRSLDLGFANSGNQNQQFYDKMGMDANSEQNSLDQQMQLYQLIYG